MTDMMNNETVADYRDNAVTYAAIDIGSNAVRLLIKQLEDDHQPRFSKVLLLRVPLRLGFDVFSNGGSISERRRKDLVRLMKSYKQLMKIYNVSDYRACATSAMRDAANGQDIIREVRKKTGIEIEIIDGQQEARMIYNNHIESMRGRRGNFMYVDVGGGSTEINLMADGELICSKSYNIGTVRMLNEAVTDGEWRRLRSDMEDLAASYPGISIVAVSPYERLVSSGPPRPAESPECKAENGGVRAQGGQGRCHRSGRRDIPDHSIHHRGRLHIRTRHRAL